MPMTLEEALKSRTKATWPYRVDVKNGDNKKINEWCEKNCKKDYLVRPLGYGHVVRFKSEKDMMLFTLTWS